MALDQAKANALKVLGALRVSAMDGYRLLKKTDLSEQDLAAAIKQELGSVVSVQGDLSPDAIGEAYFSILPSAQGLADQTISMLSMFK